MVISLQNIVSKDEDEFNKKALIDWQSMSKSERLARVYRAYDTLNRNRKGLLRSQEEQIVANNMSSSTMEKDLSDANYITSFIPKSYRSNTIKEDLVLETVEHFRQQYVQLFPKRNKLLLSPTNEVGIHVCIISI